MVLKKEGEEGASLLFLKIGFDCVAGAFNLLASAVAAAPHYVWEKLAVHSGEHHQQVNLNESTLCKGSLLFQKVVMP